MGNENITMNAITTDEQFPGLVNHFKLVVGDQAAKIVSAMPAFARVNADMIQKELAAQSIGVGARLLAIDAIIARYSKEKMDEYETANENLSAANKSLQARVVAQAQEIAKLNQKVAMLENLEPNLKLEDTPTGPKIVRIPLPQKVYIVMEGRDPEECSPEAAFSSQEKADAYEKEKLQLAKESGVRKMYQATEVLEIDADTKNMLPQ